MTWLQIARMAFALMGAIREKTQRTCPRDDCPLKLHKAKLVKPTQDDLIKRQKELYKRNHPRG